MPKLPSNQPPANKQPRVEGKKLAAFLRAEHTQLAIQVRLLDGNTHAWPYAHLAYHSLDGGRLRILFSEHEVVVRGRHLEAASEALCLQSLVYLQESGTRQQEAFGKSDLSEDQPAIDSINIYDRHWD